MGTVGGGGRGAGSGGVKRSAALSSRVNRIRVVSENAKKQDNELNIRTKYRLNSDSSSGVSI